MRASRWNCHLGRKRSISAAKRELWVGSMRWASSWTTMYSRHSRGFLARSVLRRMVPARWLQLPHLVSGKFTRRKDRQGADAGDGGQNGNGGGGYRRAQGAGEAGGTDHGAVKVHVGKYAGIELRDLNPEAVQALVDKWLPTAKANAKPTADDKRLIAALEWWAAEREKAADDVQY